MRTTLEKRGIEQITNYFFAHQLAIDDEDRREGGSEQLFQSVARQLSAAGVEYATEYQIGDPSKVGLSDREMQKRAETFAWRLQPARQALGEATTPPCAGKSMRCVASTSTRSRRRRFHAK
jgi:hypothetical protein